MSLFIKPSFSTVERFSQLGSDPRDSCMTLGGDDLVKERLEVRDDV